MKNIFKILYPILGVILLFSACTPDTYELGALANKSDLKFTVEPSSTNPNDIVLTSLTPNVTPQWITPYGNSTRVKDTVNIPFPGTYTIKYGIESAGGFVQADSVIVTITDLDKKTVSTPMWVNLAGGYGNSKTWVLDIDANGKSKYFSGPVYFAGVDYSWEWDAGWDTWIMPKADYGTMTFDLIGDAHFSSDNKTLPEGLKTGKFMLYTATNQLATFGAQVIHDKVINPDGSNASVGCRVVDWDAKVLIKSLDADHMQLVEVGDNGGIWLIYNYISKDYYDSH